MPRVEPERARQGRLGRPVLLVLIVSVALALVVWAGVEIWAEANDPPSEPTSQQGG